MFRIFQHQYARTFAEHQAATIFRERFARRSRVVRVFLRQGAQRFPGLHRAQRQHRLRAACQHHIGITVLDLAIGLADGDRRGRAGGGVSHVRALQMIFDGKVRGGGVIHAEQHAQRFHARRVVQQRFDVAVFQCAGAAQAGAHAHAGSWIFCFTQIELRILHRLFGSDQCELAETLDTAELDLAEVRGGIEILNRRTDADGELFNEVVLQMFDAGTAGQQVAEELRGVLAHGRNDAESGDDNAPGHGNLLWGVFFLLGDELVQEINHVLQRFELYALVGHGDLQFVFQIKREFDHRQRVKPQTFQGGVGRQVFQLEVELLDHHVLYCFEGAHIRGT